MKSRLLTGFTLLFTSFMVFFLIKTPLVMADAGINEAELETNSKDVEIDLGSKLILKDGTPVQEVFNSTDDMVNLIVKVIFVAAGLVLFIMIIGAGFALIQGGGKDKEKAKGTMTSAVIGFIIMLAAYWILQILQLLTGLSLGF